MGPDDEGAEVKGDDGLEAVGKGRGNAYGWACGWGGGGLVWCCGCAAGYLCFIYG